MSVIVSACWEKDDPDDNNHPSEKPVVPEAVDLGLPSGLKWASFNLGATKPEEYGDWYAWGGTEPYYSSLDPLTWKPGKEASYDWPSYKWCNGSNRTMTKYCSKSSYGYNGFTDTKTVLDPEDDAAHVNLGGKWRMPTNAEWTELREKCSWRVLTGRQSSFPPPVVGSVPAVTMPVPKDSTGLLPFIRTIRPTRGASSLVPAMSSGATTPAARVLGPAYFRMMDGQGRKAQPSC